MRLKGFWNLFLSFWLWSDHGRVIDILPIFYLKNFEKHSVRTWVKAGQPGRHNRACLLWLPQSASMARARSIVPMDGTLSNATLPFQSLLSSSPQLSIGRLVAFGLYPVHN